MLKLCKAPARLSNEQFFCHELLVETATSCVLDGTFHAQCHSPETMSVSSDRVHVNASRPSCTHRKTRSVSESPGVSQVKLAHFLSRLVCSYYGKDTLKKNILAKNTRVSIPSAQCSEDNQNCLKESKSSVQKVDVEKEESDQTKLTTCKLIVCSDVNKCHLLTSEVKV